MSAPAPLHVRSETLRRPSFDLGAGSRPALRVVGRTRHTGRFVLAIMVVAVAGVIGVVSLSALAAEAAFEARALQSEVAGLSLRYDELTSEVAALEAPARVRAIAEGELGMVRADKPTFLVAEGPTGAAQAPLTDRIKPVLGQ